MNISETLRGMDRRWIFLIVGLSVAIPLLFPAGCFPKRESDVVRPIYEHVEHDLAADDVVLLACDYDPGSMPELQPMTLAVMHHLRRRGIRFVITELWPGGIPLIENALDKIIRKDDEKFPGLPKYEYGVDYAHLGYKPGAEIVIQTMGESLEKAYPKDTYQTELAKLPILDNIKKLSDFAMVISISAGTPGTKEWVQQAQSRYKIPMASGCTAVSAPDLYPYLNSGQLIGLMGGLAGAAEYEVMVEREDRATTGMEAQSFAHLLIILFIILGNVGFFIDRRRRKAARGGEA